MDFKKFAQIYKEIIPIACSFLEPDELLLKNLDALAKDSKQLSRLVDGIVDDDQKGQDRNVIDSAINVISKFKTSNEIKFNINKFHGKNAESRKSGKTVCDDTFFRLQDMEEYADKMDRLDEASEEEDDDDDIDLMKDISDDDGRDTMFQDFFDPPSDGEKEGKPDDDEKAVDNEEEMPEDFDPRDVDVIPGSESKKILEEASDSDDSVDDEATPNVKTPYEHRREQEMNRIKKLEKDSLAAKPWQLSGETTAAKRPENSLLEEHLQFDFVSREAPLVTEESTKNLEEIIKTRIRNESWDDVVRKVKPTEQPFEFKRRVTLEHEKSKASLAQVYEQEYLKKIQGETEEVEDAAHTEIKKLARSLYHKLNALSSFHFTPTIPEPDIKVINNLPAVTVEEAIPTAVTESTLLAPEEVIQKEKGSALADTEKTKTDRLRARRVKKSIQRNKKLHEQEKNKTGDVVSSNRYVKLKRMKEKESKKKGGEPAVDSNKTLKSSKAFFARLTEEIQSGKLLKDGEARKSKSLKPTVNAKMLKL
jgi:U3 small nucleolar RNA-associated protein MPP10